MNNRDRAWLDAPVASSLAMFAVDAIGLTFMEDEDTIRSRRSASARPVPAASVLRRFGGEFAEEVMEKGSKKKPETAHA